MRASTRFVVIAVAILGAQFVRCGGDDPVVAGCGDGAIPRIVYEGQASDEAIETLWDRRCDALVGEGGPSLVAPADGGSVPADAPPVLRWEQAFALAPAPAAPVRGVGNRAKGPLPGVRLGLGEARAHHPPLNAWVYLLEIRLPGAETLWVYTTETSWQPDVLSWEAMRGAGEAVVEITSARLLQNVVDEGPYRGPSRRFHIAGVEGEE